MKLLRKGFILVLALLSASALWSQSILEPTLQERFDELSQKQQILESNFQAQTLKYQALQTALPTAIENLILATQHLQTARSDLKTSQEDLRALTLSSESLQDKLKDIENELETTRQQLAASTLQLQDLKTKLAVLGEELQTWKDKSDQISNLYDGLLIDYQTLTAKLEKLSKQYNELSTQYALALNDLIDVRAKLKVAEDLAISLQNDLSKVKKEMTQTFFKGFAWGVGTTAIVSTILYFTVLPHN